MRITLSDLLFSLSRALDFVEQELLGVTSNHGKRTAFVSMHLAKTLGCSETQVFDMASCAVLHDNALTAYMLEKGHSHNIAKLERLEIHCERGESNALDFPFLEDVTGVILHHHENWNGTGYHKLVAEDIPLRAAILRLADNLDLRLRLGMRRPSLDKEIREHVLKLRGTLYSPLVVEALLDTQNRDFLEHMADTELDTVLEQTVPAVGRDLSTEELLQVCQIFATIIDSKSPFTRNHSQGIAEKTCMMGKIYGLHDEHCNKLKIAGFLHDVGKLSTPLGILEKPGPLTKSEFEVMKNHGAVSWEILKNIKGLEEITYWATSHHEKLDGTGYPHRWSGERLSFECRLLACCDIYQALTEERPYRAGMPHDKAISIMRGMASNNAIDGDIVEKMGRELRDAAFLSTS